MQHEQVLSPGHVELQVTRLLQARRHEAQQLFHVNVGQRPADYRDWNTNADTSRLKVTNFAASLKAPLTLIVRHGFQDFLFQSVFVESERQHDGRRPVLEAQLLADAGRRHIQVQIVRVEDHRAVEGVDQQALGGGGGPATT